MAERIISHLKKLFQKNESKNYKIQVFDLDGLVMLISKELSDLKQSKELNKKGLKKAQEDTSNKLQSSNFDDSSTEEEE